MESGGFIRKNERRPSRQARYEPAYTISGFEKLRFSIAKRVSPIEIPFCNKKSARRESNPRPPPWQGGAPPLSHSRIVLCKLSVALTRTSSILLHVPGNVNSFLNFFYFSIDTIFFLCPSFCPVAQCISQCLHRIHHCHCKCRCLHRLHKNIVISN